MTMGWK